MCNDFLGLTPTQITKILLKVDSFPTSSETKEEIFDKITAKIPYKRSHCAPPTIESNKIETEIPTIEENKFTCLICFDSYLLEKERRLLKCNHGFCLKCYQD